MDEQIGLENPRKRQTPEDFDENASAKKTRVYRGLDEGCPRRIIVELVFDWMESDRRCSLMPRDVSDIVLEYLAPSPLQTLAADPHAVLIRDGTLTKPFEQALWEIFHAFATHHNPSVPVPHRTMCVADMTAWFSVFMRARPHITEEDRDARIANILKLYGMHAFGPRSELSLAGFNELYYLVAYGDREVEAVETRVVYLDLKDMAEALQLRIPLHPLPVKLLPSATFTPIMSRDQRSRPSPASSLFAPMRVDLANATASGRTHNTVISANYVPELLDVTARLHTTRALLSIMTSELALVKFHRSGAEMALIDARQTIEAQEGQLADCETMLRREAHVNQLLRQDAQTQSEKCLDVEERVASFTAQLEASRIASERDRARIYELEATQRRKTAGPHMRNASIQCNWEWEHKTRVLAKALLS